MLSVHVEVLPHLHRTLSAHQGARRRRPGVALNPSTPVVSLEEVAGDVDFVLVMSVNPGFGAQSFIPRSVPKIAAVRALLDAAGNAAPIEVDGGIDATTAPLVVGAGASNPRGRQRDLQGDRPGARPSASSARRRARAGAGPLTARADGKRVHARARAVR